MKVVRESPQSRPTKYHANFQSVALFCVGRVDPLKGLLHCMLACIRWCVDNSHKPKCIEQHLPETKRKLCDQTLTYRSSGYRRSSRSLMSKSHSCWNLSHQSVENVIRHRIKNWREYSQPESRVPALGCTDSYLSLHAKLGWWQYSIFDQIQFCSVLFCMFWQKTSY